MAADQELQVQHKREVESKEESTMPARLFLPQTDIFETSEALTLVLEMPGVDKGSVEVKVESDVLNIEGRVDFSNYDGLQPLYTEYNVGHYARSFRLSSKIEQEGDQRRAQGWRHDACAAQGGKGKGSQNQSKLNRDCRAQAIAAGADPSAMECQYTRLGGLRRSLARSDWFVAHNGE